MAPLSRALSRRRFGGLLVGAAFAGAAAPAPLVTVYKDPNCGCCRGWVAHLRAAGFSTRVFEQADLAPLRQRLGVPAAAQSCHTAVVDGYFVEGHVPASAIRRLLTKRPSARGLAVPGMPVGSPGMESRDGRVDPYAVLLVTKDGQSLMFSRHG